MGKKEVTLGQDDKMVESSHNNPLIISVTLNRYEVKRVLVDIRNSVNLLTFDVYNKLGLDKRRLANVSYLLVGLGDKIVIVLGTVNLPFELEDEKYKQKCIQSL